MASTLTWNDFDPHAKIEWAAADTEAFTLVDGRRLSTETLLEMAVDGEHPAAWWRAHVTVDVYAWLISDGARSACFSTFDEFADFCAEHRIETIWWYNAKYDFGHIDYAMLTGGWSLCSAGKMRDKNFRSLHGRQGQRYSLSVAREYKNSTRHTRTHITRHYDLCNIFGGGLAKNLVSFNVCDFDGKPIRKLDADYQEGASREYMEADAHGLYHLVRTCDAFISQKWGYTLTNGKPDVMTAGGLAKRVLLSYYNGYSHDHKANVKEFQRWHCVDLDFDTFYRKHGLYRGGITYCNEKYQNVDINFPLYKYDINSMYPYQMSRMPDLVGRPWIFDNFEEWQQFDKKDRVCVAYLIDHARGVMREGMLPFYYDKHAKGYNKIINIDECDTPLLVFADEWHEMGNWYDMTFHVKQVYAWRVAPPHAFRRFVSDHYEMKRAGKASGDKVMEAFAKLLLNSSYGKMAENPHKDVTHRELNPDTGAVVLVDDGEMDDEKCLMSVVMGALITSMARTQLLTLIRETCHVPARDFVYCDTDSIISRTQYPRPDAFTLGALKDETVIGGVPHPYTFSKFLAPKTYLLYRIIDGKADIEVHTKGIPSKAVSGQFSPDMSIKDISRIFAAGEKFVALSGMNVRGGKALVPVQKELCKVENTIVHGSVEQNTIEIMEDA